MSCNLVNFYQYLLICWEFLIQNLIVIDFYWISKSNWEKLNLFIVPYHLYMGLASNSNLWIKFKGFCLEIPSIFFQALGKDYFWLGIRRGCENSWGINSSTWKINQSGHNIIFLSVKFSWCQRINITTMESFLSESAIWRVKTANNSLKFRKMNQIKQRSKKSKNIGKIELEIKFKLSITPFSKMLHKCYRVFAWKSCLHRFFILIGSSSFLMKAADY